MQISRIVGLLMITGCTLVGGVDDPASPTSIAPPDTVLVTSVVDGDSFRSEDKEFRLFGINAPEQDECYGDVSHQWLTDWIADREVAVVPQGVDQFDRIVADIFVGTTSISREATATGHAFALSDTRATLLDREMAAMEARLGLWGDDICGATGERAKVTIEEIDFNPPGNDSTELVVLGNPSAAPVNLNGFVLRDESSINRFSFPELVLAPGDTVVVTTACAPSGDALPWCTDQPVWNNDGDAVIVLDGFGRVVAFRRY